MANQESQNKGQDKQPKKEVPLFREEVLQRKKGSYFGKAVIISPVSFSTWSLGLFVIAVLLGCFLYFGKYAKRLFPDSSGILIESYSIRSRWINRFNGQGDLSSR